MYPFFLHLTFPLIVNFTFGFTFQKFLLNVLVGKPSPACHLVLTGCGDRATVRIGQWAQEPVLLQAGFPLWVLGLSIPAHLVWPCTYLPLWPMKDVCWSRSHQIPVAPGYRASAHWSWPQETLAKAYQRHISNMVAEVQWPPPMYAGRKAELTEDWGTGWANKLSALQGTGTWIQSLEPV